MKILITELFESKSEQRKEELLYCLKTNAKLFDQVILLNEVPLSYLSLPLDSSIKEVVTGKRLTFLDAISYFNTHYGSDDTCFLSNNDISFECFNFKQAEVLLDSDTCITLSRYERSFISNAETAKLGPGKSRIIPKFYVDVCQNSQDVWISNYPFKMKRCANGDCKCYENFGDGPPGMTQGTECMNFYFGICGCDSRMAKLLKDLYKSVINPITKLITIHCHESKERLGYSNFERIKMEFIPGSWDQVDFT